jgi:hypothetical protein
VLKRDTDSAWLPSQYAGVNRNATQMARLPVGPMQSVCQLHIGHSAVPAVSSSKLNGHSPAYAGTSSGQPVYSENCKPCLSLAPNQCCNGHFLLRSARQCY